MNEFKEGIMQQISDVEVRSSSPLDWLTGTIGRVLISLFVPILTFLVLWQGFVFLRDSNAPKLVIVFIAIIWGVGGVALLYLVSNWLIEQMSIAWVARLQPFVFVGPAIAILTWYLALPTLRTLQISLYGPDSSQFVGLGNYIKILTDRSMLIAFRNNLLWILFGASFSIVFGLLIAVLADRSRFENLAKALIFLPMAISMVGAGVIWNFIYEADPNIGLLNALWTSVGGTPQAWTSLLQPWNNLFLIVIVVWLQTGFAMVLFSAAIKGIPGEILEAARVDGATEVQTFFQIMIPYIMGTIITVSTTVVIFTLKIFDIVWDSRDRYAVLSTIFHQSQLRYWVGLCDYPVVGRDSRNDLQFKAIWRKGGFLNGGRNTIS
jgi:alpha-glucoside transport system permease protein